MSAFLREHKVEIGLVVLALIVRTLFFTLALTAHEGDLISTSRAADGYFVIAQNIVAGHGFSSATEAPFFLNSFRAPLQPYFLAAAFSLFGSWWGALVLTLLIGSILPLLAMRIAAYLFTDQRIIIGAGVLLVLEPVAILFSSLFYSETLFMLFFLSSFLYLLSYMKERRLFDLALSAFLLGFAMLTRPTVEYLPLLYMILIVWSAYPYARTRALAHALLYGTIFMLVLSPWLLRNYKEFGALAMTPQAGVQLYAVLVPSVLAIENGTSFDDEFDALAAQGVSSPNKTAVGQESGYATKALSILGAHPLSTVLAAGLVEASFFTHDGMLDTLRLAKLAPTERLSKPALTLLFTDPAKLWGYVIHFIQTSAVLVLIMRLFWIVATVLFFIGAVAYVRREEHPLRAILSVATVLYFALVTIIAGLTVNARYRLPVEFLILPFALYGFFYLQERWRSRSPAP